MSGKYSGRFARIVRIVALLSFILFSSPGLRAWGNNVPPDGGNRSITVALIDVASTLQFITDKNSVTVPENGTASFNVRLSARPGSTVTATVTPVTGDPDISVKSGATLTFTRKNWKQNHKVTLFAAEDPDVANGTATIGVRALHIPDKNIVATEDDNDSISFVTDLNAVTVPEGGTAIFKVKLSAQPASPVTVTVEKISGDSDITVLAGSSLSFTTSNWNSYKTVTLSAAVDPDGANGTATIRMSAHDIPNKNIVATEDDNGSLSLVTDLNAVTVPEGGTGIFKVKLSVQPASAISATVERVSGDSDITVTSGSSLSFTTSNWNSYQTVILSAAEDPDGANGAATIGVSATGVIGTEVTATEADNESIHVTSPDGGESWFQGSVHEISWSGTPGIESNVVIELLKGGTLDQVILPSTPDDGSYMWNIPSNQSTGSTFKVRISYLSDGSIVDQSDGNFTIVDSAQDGDGDGVADGEEMGPAGDDGSYDGNNDGTPDSEQDSVASLHTFDGGHYVTVESPDPLGNVQAVTPSGDLPPDVAFPYGFFGFSVTGIGPGGATSVTLYLDSESSDIYYKYGKIPGSTTDEIYEFSYDPETVTGAEFDGFTVTLHFVDGNLGDDDLTANGIIIDQGGPGITGVSTPAALGKDCFIATAAFGSVDAPRVRLLREFRDRVLLQNRVGKVFVNAYYRYSPPLARWLSNHETARVVVRYSLIPVVWVTHLTMTYGVTLILLLIMGGLFLSRLLFEIYNVLSKRTLYR